VVSWIAATSCSFVGAYRVRDEHAASIFSVMNLFLCKSRLEGRYSLRPRGGGKEMEPG
jgi:hypothetical protein